MKKLIMSVMVRGILPGLISLVTGSVWAGTISGSDLMANPAIKGAIESVKESSASTCVPLTIENGEKENSFTASTVCTNANSSAMVNISGSLRAGDGKVILGSIIFGYSM